MFIEGPSVKRLNIVPGKVRADLKVSFNEKAY